jgi:hypothetical protein
MGTSGSFKGSGGKEAADLRNSIVDWLTDAASSDFTPSNKPATDLATTSVRLPSTPMSASILAPVIGMWRGRSGGGGGGASDAGSGRSSGGVRRTVARVAGPAARASSLARAYSSGDREVLEAAGLNYDDLRALNDPLEIGQRIAEVAFDKPADSTLEDSESRLIVAELVSWILESPDDEQPAPDEIVRHSIELMMATSALIEVGDTIRKEKNQGKRHEAEQEIRRAAQVLAAQVTLGEVGASSAEIAAAIENGVAQLKHIYGAPE